jgi:hypothetical protein
MALSARPPRRVTTGAAALLLLAGCSPVADRPDPAASAVEQEICGLVADRELSPAEIKSLRRVLDRAHQLGLPATILDPAHEIVTEGSGTTAEIDELRSACR